MTLAEEIREFKKKHGCSIAMATIKVLEQRRKEGNKARSNKASKGKNKKDDKAKG